MATILALLHEVISWRAGHQAVKAAWARDMIKAMDIDVKQTPGEFLGADILTKILNGQRLVVIRGMLGLHSLSI